MAQRTAVAAAAQRIAVAVAQLERRWRTNLRRQGSHLHSANTCMESPMLHQHTCLFHQNVAKLTGDMRVHGRHDP